MWRKRKWLIVGILAAVIVLLAGIIGGVAYAQSSTTPATTPGATENGKSTIMARVAEILGVDQNKLEAAFDQARQEQMGAALTSRLAKLVEQGKITQAEADQYQKWWETRPDVPMPLEGKGMMGGRGGMRCFPKGPGSLAPFRTQ